VRLALVMKTALRRLPTPTQDESSRLMSAKARCVALLPDTHCHLQAVFPEKGVPRPKDPAQTVEKRNRL
jgi:hypothetical protein